jgi:hypothetical protein
MTENYTHYVGRIPYKLTGLSVEILKFVCEKMSFSTLILAPSTNMEMEAYINNISELGEGLSDVLTGVDPLVFLIMTSLFDAIKPYKQKNMKRLVPCTKAIPERKNKSQISSCLVDNGPCVVPNHSCVLVCR